MSLAFDNFETSDEIQAQFNGLVDLFHFFFAELAYSPFQPFLINGKYLARLNNGGKVQPALRWFDFNVHGEDF